MHRLLPHLGLVTGTSIACIVFIFCVDNNSGWCMGRSAGKGRHEGAFIPHLLQISSGTNYVKVKTFDYRCSDRKKFRLRSFVDMVPCKCIKI